MENVEIIPEKGKKKKIKRLVGGAEKSPSRETAGLIQSREKEVGKGKGETSMYFTELDTVLNVL